MELEIPEPMERDSMTAMSGGARSAATAGCAGNIGATRDGQSVEAEGNSMGEVGEADFVK